MEANEAFNFPLTVQIKEKHKMIKEEHELVDKEKCVTANNAERDLVDSITTPTEAKVSPDPVSSPITVKVDEALEVISIELNIAPIASEAIYESEQVPASEKKCDSLEGEPLTTVKEIGKLKCNKQVDLVGNWGCLKIFAKMPLGLLFPNNSPELYKSSCDANSAQSSILPPRENDADIGTNI
ncbi:hypothetical protein MA16_Dca010998 [Dendrobium catenatum]|uniref:Uncharacterized protein n=1 Tax=Dendrobium catenatum TaxID=906689 RepID=A0A2I0WCD3_9ASPA|nr:hypothetical protein MA16_Dca010998 [Dendrobium catenatum]